MQQSFLFKYLPFLPYSSLRVLRVQKVSFPDSVSNARGHRARLLVDGGREVGGSSTAAGDDRQLLKIHLTEK